MLNGINIDGLNDYIQLITEEPGEAISSYGIKASWKGGVKTEIRTLDQQVGSKHIKKDFKFDIGEPEELLGDNSLPTPQDYLLGGLAGCMMVNFVLGAAKRNIKLDSVELTITGDLNLRGFLNVDKEAPIGFDEIKFHFDAKGDGTQNDYDVLVRNLQHFSPNYRTISDAVKLSVAKLETV